MANIKLTKNILQLISKLLNESGNEKREPTSFLTKTQPESTRKTLITEKDIMKLNKNQKILVVEKGTIITPLAKDRARAMGIRLEKRGGA